MKKIFFDCEFTGLHQKTTLLSIGFVAESGETFYAEMTDYDPSQVTPWIEDNVFPYFSRSDWDLQKKADVTVAGDTKTVALCLTEWLSQFHGKLQLWGDCIAYDWVLFCNLWGNAFNIPRNVHYIPMDLCTLLELKGVDPDESREKLSGMTGQHHALQDALMIKACYEKLMEQTTNEAHEKAAIAGECHRASESPAHQDYWAMRYEEAVQWAEELENELKELEEAEAKEG